MSAQARYAAGTREILESWLAGTPIRDEYLIVDGGAPGGDGCAFLLDQRLTSGPDRGIAVRAGPVRRPVG